MMLDFAERDENRFNYLNELIKLSNLLFNFQETLASFYDYLYK